MAGARVSAGPVTAAYSIRSVSMEYRSRRGGRATGVLRTITFDIARGEMVTIVGRSGSGKSSLLQLMAGLDVPTAGTIVCRPNGNEDDAFGLHSMSENERARFRGAYIGFVFQAFHLLPNFTAWENVAVPLMFAGVPLKDRRAHAHDLLSSLDMPRLADRYPYELSGGEQQRVAVARALANKPSVLLADEPTGNLDTTSSRRVIDLLLNAHEAREITTVLVTHDHEVARHLGSRVVELSDGVVVHDSAMDGFA